MVIVAESATKVPQEVTTIDGESLAKDFVQKIHCALTAKTKEKFDLLNTFNT